MKKYIKGFTLIELLVVIAIIGILASVVLVSLNSARGKGKDTHIIADVQQLRTQFESDSNGSDYSNSFAPVSATVVYIGNPSNNGNISTILNDADANGPTGYITASTTISGTNSVTGQAVASSPIVVVINGTGSATAGQWGTKPTAYAIWGRTSSNNYFCIDSTGNTKNGTTAVPATTAADSFCH